MPCAISAATANSAVVIRQVSCADGRPGCCCAGMGPKTAAKGYKRWNRDTCADRADAVEAGAGMGAAGPQSLTTSLLHVPFRADRDQAPMHRYRSHTCGDLREADIGQEVRLSGWCHRIRDHGGLLFIDLRDHYGITQLVVDPDSAAFQEGEELGSGWVGRTGGK